MPTTAPQASAFPCQERSLLLSALLIILLTGLFSASSLGQRKSIKQYVHDRWTTQNGFPQNSASDIIQTKEGYLWFATQEGLARFDGVQFTVFDRANTDALPDSWIQRFVEDSTGALWIRVVGFAPGLTRYQNGAFTHFTTANGLPNNSLNAPAVDKEGGIWFGTLGGLSHFKGGKFSNYSVKDGLPGDSVFSLGLDSKNNLWMSTSGGLARYSNGKIEALTGTPAFPDTTFYRVHDFSSVFEDKSGTLWMCTPRGILSYSGGSSRLYTTKDGLSSITVNDVHQDSKGDIWFATSSGLSRFQNGRFLTYRASTDPDENTIFGIREDSEGSLWLVTGKGIKRYVNGNFESYKQEDGLSDNVVQRMFIDREGSIWMGTFGGGIDRFRNANFITYSARTGLTFDNVQPVIEDSKGALWIGSNSAGVDRIKDGVVTSYTSKNGLPANDVRDLAEDEDGNVWIATTRGLVSFKNGTFTTRSRQTAAGPEPLGNAMVQLKSGAFLVASRNRVFTTHGDKLTPLFSIDSVATRANFIQDIWQDSRGTLWVAAIQNLHWYKDGKLKRVTKEDGFEGSWVQSFYEDNDGTIWLGVSSHGHRVVQGRKIQHDLSKAGSFRFQRICHVRRQPGLPVVVLQQRRFPRE